MRMTQFVGLTQAACKWLDIACKKEPAVVCNSCGAVVREKLKSTVYSKTYGMFEEEIPLHQYETLGGSIVREVVQAIPWSSGPVIFLCLEFPQSRDRICEHPQCDIDNC